MIRKQIYLVPEQDRAIKQRARRLGVPEAEVIRTAIDVFLMRPVSGIASPALWREELSYMERRLSLDVEPRRRSWRREDLYADRLDRWQRDRSSP